MSFLGIVVVGVLQRDTEFLVGMRPQGKPGAGLLETIGGKYEETDITLENALVREYKEETDAIVTIVSKLANNLVEFPDGIWDVHIFEVQLIENSPVPICKVHDWLEWLPLDEIKKYPRIKSLDLLLEKLLHKKS